MTGFRSAMVSLGALAFGVVVLSAPACAPSSNLVGGEGVNDSGSDLTGSLPVGTVLIATADVNLRTGPSSSYESIDVVPSGASVVVVASSPKGGFYDVRYGSEVGWSSGKYYERAPASSTSSTSSSGAGGASSSSSSATASSSTTASSTTASSSSSGGVAAGATMVATADVNLRSGPSTSDSIVDVIPDGSTVTLLSGTEQNGFYNVQYQSETGWSSASYLELSSSSSSSTSSTSSSSSGATSWSCTGLYGTVPMADGEYYATEFGCYIDSNGIPQQDPGDNCIPACLAQAQSSGLCAGLSGPDCEDSVNWYSADGARFGCLARLKVTNEANGLAVVVVALDYGPGCSVEATVQHAAIDLSYPADAYLFGGETGISDEALVHVDVVDASTPLGPVM